MNRITLIILTTLFAFSSYSQDPVSHRLFDELLQQYVNEDGLVNYEGLKSERKKLNEYLILLSNNAPDDSWTSQQQLAYWINAYNAYTLDLILEHYPVNSIKDIGSLIKIPFVSTAWDIEFIQIGDETYDLNDIEHGIIRKQFNEPRIHFALVCAAVSCPKLQNTAFVSDKLEEQLAVAASGFLNDSSKNEFRNSKNAKLSKIFNWYGGDFNNDGTLIAYLNQYAPIQLDKNARISWMDYDWNLNTQ